MNERSTLILVGIGAIFTWALWFTFFYTPWTLTHNPRPRIVANLAYKLANDTNMDGFGWKISQRLNSTIIGDKSREEEGEKNKTHHHHHEKQKHGDDPVSSSYFANFRVYNEVIPAGDRNQEKLVVIYTTFYGDPKWMLDKKFTTDGVHYRLNQGGFHCPHKCAFSFQKNLSASAHAILFGILEDPCNSSKLPKRTSKDQIWIGCTIESGAYGYHNREHCPLNKMLNWTFTFRLDSDVHWPYGYFEKFDPTRNTLMKEISTSNKPYLGHLRSKKLAVALISNCYTPNGRQELINSLEKLVPVDTFGNCGSPCPKSGDECKPHLARRYKFFLAFENSHCQDYVTEKFFHTFQHGIVPIVYGRANYAKIAPPHSYIDVMDFPSVQALADYLTYLDQNDEEYLKYFEWQKTYNIRIDYEERFCNLCGQLWNPQGVRRKEYINFFKWFTSRTPSAEGLLEDHNLDADSRRRDLKMLMRRGTSSCTDMDLWRRQWLRTGSEKKGVRHKNN